MRKNPVINPASARSPAGKTLRALVSHREPVTQLFDELSIGKLRCSGLRYYDYVVRDRELQAVESEEFS
jgi:hypothetical protein